MIRKLKLLSSVTEWLRRISTLTLTGLGFLLLFTTLFVSLWLERKDFAIAVAITGTFFGTAVLSLYLPKLIISGGTIVGNGDPELAAKLERAHRDIERLQGMRINVDAVHSVLKLGLYELVMHVTDFKRDVLNTEEAPWHTRGDKIRTVYTGAFRLPIKAQLGVDLKELCVQEAGDKLLISGIKPTQMVDTLAGAEWFQDEIRSEKLREDGAAFEIAIDPAHALAKDKSRDHEREVRQRLSKGDHFQHFDGPLLERAQQTIASLLAPLGRAIVFGDANNGHTHDLLAYLKSHNHQIEIDLAEKRRKLSDNSQGVAIQ